MDDKLNDNTDCQISDQEIEDSSENDNESVYYTVSSYGADYSVDGIVKRLDKKQILVPSFQRSYVWDIKKASRFIESLILGLPVPGVFLSRDSYDKKTSPNQMLIIDGQQRLLSLQKFYKGRFGDKVFKLEAVCEELEGRTYEDLNPDDQSRLDDAIIHATIIKQDAPEEDNSSIYMIFERLNTGGMLLQPQEIRACIYYGEFNDLLNKLILTESWRSLYKKVNSRMKEQELILRFFALYYHYAEYKKGMKKLLNNFMQQNRSLTFHTKDELTELFTKTIDLIVSANGKDSFRRGKAVNATLFDSIMIGVAKRLSLSPMSKEECHQKYNELIQDPLFVEYTSTATSDERQVKGRINKAIDYFSEKL